jgi:hypothetical protein
LKDRPQRQNQLEIKDFDQGLAMLQDKFNGSRGGKK